MHECPLKILIVDDDASIRDMLSIVLKKEGFTIDTAENGRTFLGKIKKNPYDLVISDIKMPDINGIELLKKIKQVNPQIPVIMITAYASTNDAVLAMKYGAEDYIIKPFNIEELKILINKSIRQRDMEIENLRLKKELMGQKGIFQNMIGKNPAMLEIFKLVDNIADTDSSVLISGESGTGKELIARAIHNKSNRNDKQFVSVNCGALPADLLESELFGHKKGSFTDAYRDKEGLFSVAHRGTLFLDEIGEMSPAMQVKLLRAIQERRIRKVGDSLEQDVDVRIISATNKDLSESKRKKEFRDDLYYRLNVISIHLPPLRERRDDIELLTYHFLDKYNQRMGKSIRGFEDDVLESFRQYAWPGNVRELENCVERAVALEKGETIRLASVPREVAYSIADHPGKTPDLRQLLAQGSFDYNRYIESLGQDIIREAMKMAGYRQKKAARLLNLSYRSLRYLLDKYQIKKSPD